MVDVQRAFDQWEAAGKRRNNPDAVKRIAELLAGFRKRKEPIIHIRHEGTKPESGSLPTARAIRSRSRRAGKPASR